MSWMLTVGAVEVGAPDAIARAADAALAELRAKGRSYAAQFDAPETKAEVATQLEAATGAAAQLLASGALGDVAEVHVTLSGHANPGHQPRQGWAPDQVTVTVNAVHAKQAP